MQTIYHPANPIDAQRLVSLLAEHDIEAHVQGTYLGGGVGELPAGDLLRVWVHDGDVAQAREVVAEFEAELKEISGLFDVDDDEPPAPPMRPVPAAGGVASSLVGLLFGLAIGFGLAYWHLRLPHWSEAIDYDEDGIVDTTYDYHNELMVKSSEDRNGDGEIDLVTEIGIDGSGTGRMDDDFDGRFEYDVRYEKNLPASMHLDEDADGFTEYRMEFTHGVLTRGVYLDPATKTEFKREYFEHDLLVRAELDIDRDGTFETKREYDRTGEIVP